MPLNYTSLTALINEKYMPVLYDQIFRKDHYVTAIMKQRAKTYNDRKIVTPLEYANGSNAQPTSEYGLINLQPIDPFTAAEWEPRMITDSLVISLQEELVTNSEMAVKSLIDSKLKNVQKGLEKYFATRFWARTTGATEWNSLDTLVNSGNNIGGIDGATYTWWNSNVIDAAGADYADDPSLEADLLDPGKDVYLKKLLQRGVAKAKHMTGENPDVIVVTQYIFDLIEFLLDPQKTGSKMNERAGQMGFTALDYRGIPIVADDDMVEAQTGDTDGRMYFLNLDYLYMFFNSGAKFKAESFVRAANQNAKSCLINAYGNSVISNRKAQCVITNLRSPKAYAA